MVKRNRRLTPEESIELVLWFWLTFRESIDIVPAGTTSKLRPVCV